MVDVSIVIPAYNVEQYISKTLESCISQTYGNIEIIVINDGSKDNTWSVIKKYSDLDNRIKAIDKENGGVSSARNIGLDNVSGKFIIFLDADDWLELNAIEELIIHNENGILVCCDSFWVDISGKRESKSRLKIETVLSKEESLLSITCGKYNTQSSCYKLFDNEIIKKYKLRFNENIPNGEDGLFTFKYLCCVDGIHYYPLALWNILCRPESATTSTYKPKMNSALEAIELMLEEDIPDNIEKALHIYYLNRAMGLLIDSIKDRYLDKMNRRYLRIKIRKYYREWIRSDVKLKDIAKFFILEFSPYLILKIIFKKRHA